MVAAPTSSLTRADMPTSSLMMSLAPVVTTSAPVVTTSAPYPSLPLPSVLPTPSPPEGFIHS